MTCASPRGFLAHPPACLARTPSLPLLVGIAISGTFPVHLFVPVLPEAARDLHVSAATIQSAITAYLIGLSLGQLLLGPLSDRYGRRPVLISGLLVYVLGSLGAGLAPNMPGLIIARMVQAIGGCAGLVLGRAIVRDITAPDRLTRKLAVLAAAMTLGPGVAPLLGAYLAIHFGWRGMFAILAIVSAGLLSIIALILPETHLERRSVPARQHLGTWIRLLWRRDFLSTYLGSAMATTSFYAFVANAPFIFHERFGFSIDAIGWLYFVVVCSLTAGFLIASLIGGRFRPQHVVLASSLIMTIAATLSLVIALADATTFTEYMALIMILSASIGVCGPFTLTIAVNAQSEAVGAASGLYGCLQMAAGALIIVALGAVKAPPVLATSIVIAGACGFSLVCFVVGAGVGRKKAVLF